MNLVFQKFVLFLCIVKVVYMKCSFYYPTKQLPDQSQEYK